LCSKYNCTKTQLALSYILSYPEVSVVIPGIRTVSQAVLNTSGLFGLDQKDRKLIEDLGKKDFSEVMKLIQQQG
jgi:aryl-alcohol dehydrogenase-like predicted oxidoreductase